MTCESCGDKPKKCNKDFTKAVIEIDNPEQITLMRKVTIPASMGDDTTVPPVVGKYKNVLLYYEANQKSYLYSSDGVPTQLVNGVTDYEAAVNLPQINGYTLLGNKSADDLGLQDKLTAGENISIDEHNVISAVDTTYGPATDTEIGLVKPGEGLSVDTDGTLSVDTGDGLSVDSNDALRVNAGDGLNIDVNNDLYAIKYVFDTVADMKASTDLANGDSVRTLGFYSLNDGGGAIYKITDSGTANEMDVIAVGGLYANLQHTDTIYIKQLGAKGDGVTNDTVKIDRAFAIADNVIMNKTSDSYLVTYLKVLAGKKLEGECLPYVQIDMQRGDSQVIPIAYDNTTIDKIYVNSLDQNLSNNRFDIRNSHIRITNSRFDGFRDSGNNAWGILLTGANDVMIKNCYFDNNSQSDIAIVEGCKNITIDGCSGTAFHINMEPAQAPYINNVAINDCVINRLDIRENQNTYTTINSLLVSNCTIDLVEYDGGTTTFENCVIKAYQNQGIATGGGDAGIIKFINTGLFSRNLIPDPYINDFKTSSTADTFWHGYYSPQSADNSYSFDKVGNEEVFTINPNNIQTSITMKCEPISVDPTKMYILKIRGGAQCPETGSGNISKYCTIDYRDSDNENLNSADVNIFRCSAGSSLDIHDEYFIFKPIPSTDNIVIKLRNSIWGTQKIMFASVELFEIKSNEFYNNSMQILPINTKRVFVEDSPATNINYPVGSIAYSSSPTTYIGKVVTGGGYTPDWTDFGALAP